MFIVDRGSYKSFSQSRLPLSTMRAAAEKFTNFFLSGTSKLAEKFDYQNTYYHEEPRLDIAAAGIAPEFMGKDFIISSEVLEHVTPPVSRAFENVRKMLKPGGLFVLTVPYGTQVETVEHFPELHEFSIVEKDGSFVLRNKTQAGVVQEFNDLIFHGGPAQPWKYAFSPKMFSFNI